MIVAANLSKTYGSGPAAVRALSDVYLQISAGQRIAVVGRSGSGKSTLMNLLGGLDVPSGGTLTVANRDLTRLSRRQLADFRGNAIGFVFQSFHLLPTRTVQQNVELPLLLAGLPRKDRARRAAAALEKVGLLHRAAHRPSELSGGERQRTAVARAVVHAPAVILADEPTGNLDSASAAAVMELLLAEVSGRGTTLVLVTHDEPLAGRVADRTVRMADGRVLV